MENMDKSLSNMMDNVRNFNQHLLWAPKEDERENGAGVIVKR